MTPAPPPPVVRWYKVYAAAMALLYLFCAVGGGALIAFHRKIGELDRDPDAAMIFLIQGVLFLVLGLVLLAVFAAALFLPPKPWVWIYHIVLISIGLSSPCCMPASIPLLIFWIKPEAKAYFGRSA